MTKEIKENIKFSLKLEGITIFIISYLQLFRCIITKQKWDWELYPIMLSIITIGIIFSFGVSFLFNWYTKKIGLTLN